MDSKKLEILMTAADLGSFTKASEVAGYTQSGLTHMMDSLEREIGFPLLIRGHDGVSLTPEGEQLMPSIRDFLQANAALENKIQAISIQKSEIIRVAAYSSIALKWMPEILYRLKRECPEITVDLRMVDHVMLPFDLLDKGETDIILASHQPSRKCKWLPLYDEPMYAVLPKDYPLNGRSVFPLEEFAGQHFLMPYGNFDMDIESTMSKVGAELDLTMAKVDDETIIRMVGLGMGVTMMAELMLRGRTDDVLCVPVEPATVRELGLGLSSAKSPSDNVQKLINCVQHYIKNWGGEGKVRK